MFIEFSTCHGLLSEYLKHKHPDATVLVVWIDDIDSIAEWETLKKELADIGMLPPDNFMLPGILMIELPDAVALNLVNRHEKGSFRMEVYENGQCIHENY